MRLVQDELEARWPNGPPQEAYLTVYGNDKVYGDVDDCNWPSGYSGQKFRGE